MLDWQERGREGLIWRNVTRCPLTFYLKKKNSWRIFFKDQGQEESTPRVVGGKKNNTARWHLGTTTLFTSSVITSALLGCLGNLHNTVLTHSLQLSITIGMVFSVFLLYFLSSYLSLSPDFFLSLCLMFIWPSKKDWFHIASALLVQQIRIWQMMRQQAQLISRNAHIGIFFSMF